MSPNEQKLAAARVMAIQRFDDAQTTIVDSANNEWSNSLQEFC